MQPPADMSRTSPGFATMDRPNSFDTTSIQHRPMPAETSPPGLTSPLLGGLSGIGHRFLGREGGVSAPPFASLNASLHCGDDAEAVAENRRRITRLITGRPLAIARQVHGRAVWRVAGRPESAPDADALVTTDATLALGILSADCVPVLFADPQARVIAAAHAGWRGALAGVTDAALDALQATGADPTHMHAAIGPAIQQPSYPVSPALEQQFLEQSPFDCHACFDRSTPDAPRLDLPRYVELRLRWRGLSHIDRLEHDTCTLADQFFSHRSGGTTGRQLSVIWLRD